MGNKNSSTTLFGELAVTHTLTPHGQKILYTMIMPDLALCNSSPGSSFCTFYNKPVSTSKVLSDDLRAIRMGS